MQRLKTFLVEDSPIIRDNLIATLEEIVPVTVVGWADNEAAALAWLDDAAHPADLLIIDIFLSGQGSGLGVIQQTCSQQPRPVLVVLSNHTSADMRAHCLALGADEVFDKSHDIDALINYCERLAAHRAGRTSA